MQYVHDAYKYGNENENMIYLSSQLTMSWVTSCEYFAAWTQIYIYCLLSYGTQHIIMLSNAFLGYSSFVVVFSMGFDKCMCVFTL